jgi:hypothetical protein
MLAIVSIFGADYLLTLYWQLPSWVDFVSWVRESTLTSINNCSDELDGIRTSCNFPNALLVNTIRNGSSGVSASAVRSRLKSQKAFFLYES